MKKINFSFKRVAIFILILSFLGLTSAFAIYKEETNKEDIEKEADTKSEEQSLMSSRLTLEGFSEDKKPQYAPDELIVKFKPELGSKASKLFKENNAFSSVTGTNSLDELNTKFKVKKIERVFKSLETAGKLKGKEVLTTEEYTQEIKKKFPKRTLRAPKDAKIPDLENIYQIKLGEGANILEAVEEYKKDSNVVYAEPNYILQIQLVPNDPIYYAQYSHRLLETEYAWDVEIGDGSVIVGVIDTGIYYTHPDLAANMWDDSQGHYGYDFVNNDSDPMDDNGHGTLVSGIIGAIGNNNKGVAGFAWSCKLMAIKIIGSDGYGSDSNVAAGINYAVDSGADVINASVGGYGDSSLVRQAIEYATAHGVLAVAAAGNDNRTSPLYPAGYNEVISVACTDENDIRCYNSNFGTTIDFTAPGVNIPSTQRYGGYGSTSVPGTSFSTPHVTGIVALLLSHRPGLSLDEIYMRLVSGADEIDSLNPAFAGQLGIGRINARYVLEERLNPNLSATEFMVIDTQGNSDGEADPGETVDLEITLLNKAFDALNVEATLETSNSNITIIDGSSGYGDIPHLQSSTNTSNPFRVKIEPCTPVGTFANFLLTISAQNGYRKTVNISVLISGFHTLTVDPQGSVGYANSIAIDSQNRPHISYIEVSPEFDLKYAFFNGTTWHIEVVEDNPANTGQHSSIALDSQNKPHISYYRKGDLGYAYFNGTNWDIKTIDINGTVGWFNSITIDSNDNPHISYFDATNGNLKYAYFDGTSWHIETVDSGNNTGWYTSIALDSSDHPHISYTSGPPEYDLKYAYFDGTSWHIETVDPSPNNRYFTSIGVDKQNRPHIAYFDLANKSLKYAFFEGSNWHIETVDSTGQTGYDKVSISIDLNDNPHISYFDSTNAGLKYAYFDGTSWHIQTVDSKGKFASSTSIAIDSLGNPHISYLDSSNENLKYAFYKPHTPLLNSIGNKIAEVGGTVQFIVSGCDPDGDILTYSVSGLPSGATFNASTKVFSWTPSQGGTYSVNFTVTDSHGASDSETIQITVSSPSRPPPCTCFLGGTPILMGDGSLKAIEKVKVGDRVLAFDEATREFKQDTVKEFFKHKADKYLIINGHLKVTDNHLVYSKGEWIEIGKLKVGDTLFNAKGELERITSIKEIKRKANVYNLEVNPYHTYIAGGIVVHNKPRGACITPVY